jgi:hypothetical protein
MTVRSHLAQRVRSSRRQRPGSPRLRAATAAGALAVAGASGAISIALAAPDWRRLAVILTVIAWCALVGTVVFRRSWLPWSAASLAGAAALTIAEHRGEAVAIVGLAAAIVAVVELAGWSIDRRSIVPEDAVQTRRRALEVAATVVGSGTLAATMVLIGRLPAPDSALTLVMGIVAALAVTALVTGRRWER